VESTIYYHFTGATLCDGTPIPAIGKWLTFEGTPIPCKCGLHAAYARAKAMAECAEIVRREIKGPRA
jgi:hypothetical protein